MRACVRSSKFGLMFAEPTLNDFLDNVRWHLKKAATNAGRAVATTLAELNAKGALLSWSRDHPDLRSGKEGI